MASQLEPNNTWYLDNAGFCYQRLQRYDQALQFYQRSREIDKRDAWNLRQTGFCHQKSQNYQKALEFHLKSKDVDPHDVWNLGCIGWCFFVLGDLHQAHVYLKKCLSNGEDEYDLLNLGHIFLCQGNIKKAKLYYQKSLLMFSTPAKFFRNFEEDTPYLTNKYTINVQFYAEIKKSLVKFWDQKSKFTTKID